MSHQKLANSALSNIHGTTSNRFRLGKTGPWLSHGPDAPDDQTGANGDLFIRTGRMPALYVRKTGGWVRTNDIMMEFNAERFTAADAVIPKEATYVGLRILGGGKIELPAGVMSGKSIVIKDEGNFASDHPVEVITTDGTRIDGDRSITIDKDSGSVTVLFNGINWVVTSRA